ncbi:MAG: GAF domain-containing sensor histidine kinase [Anaerolineales bacterium]|nr:GAF domain-containing sensor histidine kinase [Anaerolineales bacterium]
MIDLEKTTSSSNTESMDELAQLENRVRELEASHAREKERLESLLEVSSVLSSTLNLPRLLEIILDCTVKLTKTEASSILLIDPETGYLYFEATSNIPHSQIERIQVPIEGSVAGWVVKNAKPRLFQKIKDGEEFTASAKVDRVTTFSTNSLLAVPLTAKAKVIGVLEAVNKLRGQPFNEEDEDTLMVLAGQAAIAIENARLFQQSDFISEMVHELRTPMMALVTLSDLLSKPNIPAEKNKEISETIQQETRRLTKMTSNFLELSRLESGRVHLKHETINLDDLVHETVKIQEQQANDKGIQIKLEFPDNLPVLIGDGNRIKQVFLNLISNAIKYNRQDGSIFITAETTGEMVQICVKDTGRGIPDDAIKNLFNRFYRVPDNEGYSTGSGLGLSITKQIVQQHGGKIWVESEWQKGSSFCFTLPLQIHEPRRPLRLDEDF